MKIRILNPDEMCVGHRKGDIVEVWSSDSCDRLKDNLNYLYEPHWESAGYFEVVQQEPTNDFQRAWEPVWDTICNYAPQDLFNQIGQDGSGIENTVELIKTLSKHYEESSKSALDIQHLIAFTANHKNLEISIEDGKIVAKDWRGNGEPVEYSFDTIEQLEEFTNAWDIMRKYHHET